MPDGEGLGLAGALPPGQHGPSDWSVQEASDLGVRRVGDRGGEVDERV